MTFHLDALIGAAVPELRTRAQADGLALPANADHGELVFALAVHRLEAGATGHADGVLEVLPDGFGFVRAPQRHFAPMPYDVFVSPAQIRHLNLKTGHRLVGPLRPPRDGERFLALAHVDRVNGGDEAELARRVPFALRTPVLPTQRLRLDVADDLELRAQDLLAPWALGHRALLRLPPGSDGAGVVRRCAAAVGRLHPALVRIVVLIDQRPEALAAAQAALAGCDTRVLGTTFDEPPARHVAVAEFALQMAQREVEARHDVVLLFGDLVHLARAANLAQAPSGRLLCAGLDATAVLGGKRLFAAARACEGGGSLTVVATATAGESTVEQTIAEQFVHRGNSEGTWRGGPLPGEARLDVAATCTRPEDVLLPPPLLAAWRRLHHELQQLPPAARLTALLARLATGDNAAVLRDLVPAREGSGAEVAPHVGGSRTVPGEASP